MVRVALFIAIAVAAACQSRSSSSNAAGSNATGSNATGSAEANSAASSSGDAAKPTMQETLRAQKAAASVDLRSAIRVSSGDPKDQREVERVFREQAPQLWGCVETARATGRATSGGEISVHFRAIEGSANELTSTGLEPGADKCVEQVVHAMRFGAFTSGDLVVDVKLAIPKA